VKAEAWIFAGCTIFLVLVTPAYWLVTDASAQTDGGDWTGTSALAMTTLLTLMVTIFLGFHAKKMDPRPEDRKDAEIADGAGELGFFPPYSWWPLWCALALGAAVFAVAMGAWWLVIIGGVFGGVALSGWIYEYYRGEHAH
jgi:membrane protease YdiL (CAAX protease family)